MIEPNPYNYNLPVDSSMFFGRHQDVARLARRLLASAGGDSFALIGGRRMGKTSFLRALERTLQEARPGQHIIGLPIRLDLSDRTVQTPSDFFGRVAELGREVFSTQLELSAPTLLFEPGPPGLSFARLIRQWAQIVLRQRGSLIRFILLLDECEEIVEKPWVSDLHAMLRAILVDDSTQRLLKVVMAGSHGFHTQVRSHGSPLWNVLVYHTLQVFDLAATRELITIPVAMPLAEEVIESVVRESGGHPFLTQYLMTELYENGLTYAQPAHVERLATGFARLRNDFYDWARALGETTLSLYNLLATGGLAMSEDDLHALAPELGSDISRGLTALTYHGVVAPIPNSDPPRYQTAGLMFQRWADRYRASLPASSAVSKPHSSNAAVHPIGAHKHVASLEQPIEPTRRPGKTSAVEIVLTMHRLVPGQYLLEVQMTPPDGGMAVQPHMSSSSVLHLSSQELLNLATNPTAYGQFLTQQLFEAESVRLAFLQASTIAQQSEIPLQLRLKVGQNAPELQHVRWETILHPQHRDPLALRETIRLARLASSDEWSPLRSRQSVIQLLTAVAAPHDLEMYGFAQIDVAGEITRAIASAPNATHTILPGQSRMTLSALIDSLRAEPDILYLVCHGRLIDDRPYLWFERTDGSSEPVDGEQLAVTIRGLVRRPTLALLNMCYSGGAGRFADQVGEPAALSLGAQLVAAGVPAVVAMQGPISMSSAQQFMPRLLTELQHDGRIDRAVAVARRSISGQSDWWVPTLLIRVSDGHIWARE